MTGRAIIIMDSLRDGILPPTLVGRLTRTYQHPVGGLPTTIAEARVPQGILGRVLLDLSGALRSEGYYAHVRTEECLFVCFPGVIVCVPKGNEAAAGRAQEIGGMFGIRLAQMRFLEMFTVDHPDA
jgi:hypothetical protein